MSKEHKLRALGLQTASEFWGSIGLQVGSSCRDSAA